MRSPLCAYPRCPGRGSVQSAGAVREHSGSVWLCESCGGLQFACASLPCQRSGSKTLNRPFALHCRRCKELLEPRASEVWGNAGCSSWSSPLLKEVTQPIEVADLSERVGRVATGRTRVAMTVEQGLLALHEVHVGGGLLALVRPFAGPDRWSVWEARDPISRGDYERPFDPIFLPGGRYVVFARARRILVQDLWGCQGLSALGESKPAELDLAAPGLAAPPVPLDGSTLGLLRGGGGAPLFWEVWRLSHDGSAAGPATVLEQAGQVYLEALQGDKVQVTLVDDRVLAFATAKGHWVWSRENALACNADVKSNSFPRTWPKDDRTPDQIVLDEHVLNQEAHQQPGQGFLIHKPKESERFQWYYRVVRNTPQKSKFSVEQYDVEFASLRATGAGSLDEALGEDREATPLGPTRTDPVNVRMLFKRVGKLRLGNTGGAIAKSEIQLPNRLTGLRLFDPLIVAITPDDQGRRRLHVYSLIHQHESLVIAEMDGIVSDPLVWGRWLFTAEFQDDRGLKVNRRALFVES